MNERVVLVSGGAGNVGRAATRAFLETGARVAVPFYKTEPPAVVQELRSEFGDRLLLFALDLTTERGAQGAVRQATDWGGRLDAVVHMIGGYRGGMSLVETPIEMWEHMIELNLTSAWLVARFAIPRMLASGGGSFVFVSSRAALQRRAGRGAYAIAKAGLLTLVATIAEEHLHDGIRANVILPGTVDTPDNRRQMPDAAHERWTRPEEIARVILFLASPDSAPINGAAIPVYGRS